MSGRKRKSDLQDQSPTTAKKQKTESTDATPVTNDPNRKLRVFADGVYDMFHYGHAKSLKQAREVVPNAFLVVGVASDEDTWKIKGPTVMTEKERAESVRHCKYVDEVIENSPWVLTPEFVEKHKIDIVVHGEDLSVDENGNDVYAWLKEAGKFRTIKRTDGISTSDLINRILSQYNDYVKRNLARGYSGKQMNIGFVKEQRLKLENKLDKIKKKVKEEVDEVVHKSDNFIHDFLARFGKENMWDKIKESFKSNNNNEDEEEGDVEGQENVEESAN
jgi:choline-phosphate cytidylyltransferase